MKKLLILAVVFMSAFTFVGCNSNEASDEIYIPIVSKGFQHQFWQAVKAGAEQAAKEYGVTITFEGPESESMVDVQVDMVTQVLNKDPDALCLAALDTQALENLLQQADDAGIPIVAFDSGVDSDIPVATAATDNYNAAAAAAHKMAEAIGGEGKVAVIAHDQVSATGIQRRDGFKETIENDYPNIEIVAIQYGGGDHLESANLVKSILNANPDIDGVFGTNEGSAIGVLNGVKELGKLEDVIIIGFDSGQAQQDAVRAGEMYGAISQNPVAIGYEAVKAAVFAIRGVEIPETTIDTGFVWYDSSNIDDADVQAVLYA